MNILRLYGTCGQAVFIGRTLSGTFHTFVRFHTSFASTASTYSSARTASLFFSINVRLPAQHLSGIVQNQRHYLLIHAAWIYIASYKPSSPRKKHAGLGDKRMLQHKHPRPESLASQTSAIYRSSTLCSSIPAVRETLTQVPLRLSCTRALLSEASKCSASDSRTEGVWCSPLQVHHNRCFQLLPRMMVPSARNEELVPQRFYGSASLSVGSVHNAQELEYRRTAFAPPHTLPLSLFQLLCQPIVCNLLPLYQGLKPSRASEN